jgi:hypothetical protein
MQRRCLELVNCVLFVFNKVGMAEHTSCILLSGFMEAVHIELPYETVDVAVPEVLGQHNLLEFINVFYHELGSIGGPKYNFVKLRVLD